MKQLRDLTEKEYNKLDKIGMLYVLYPEATGKWRDDCQPEQCEYKEGDIVIVTKQYANNSPKPGMLVKIKKVDDDNNVPYAVSDCFNIYSWGYNFNYEWCVGVRKPEHSEIEAILIQEAKKRYNIGDIIPVMVNAQYSKVKSYDFMYDVEKDELDVLCRDNLWRSIYTKGKWAEIIKEEPIKIGGYEVKFEKGSVKVGCKEFTNEDVRDVEAVSELACDSDCDIHIGKNGDIMLYGLDGSRCHSLTLKDLTSKIISNLKD